MSRRTTPTSPRLALTMLACGALVASIAACGAPQSSSVRDISARDLPAGPFATTVPPTTSTTPPSLAETTSPPTTAEPEPVEAIQLYFIDDETKRLAPVPDIAPVGVTIREVLERLEDGPDPADLTYRSAVPPDAIIRVSVDGDTVEVVLADSVDDIPATGNAQNLAIGQIVLTALNKAPLTKIRFRDADGLGKSVPLGDGTNSGPDRFLTFEDYAGLLGSIDPNAQTDTTTATGSTEVTDTTEPTDRSVPPTTVQTTGGAESTPTTSSTARTSPPTTKR